jgi:hypothetical protein
MNDSDLGMSEIANFEHTMHEKLSQLKFRDWYDHLDEIEAILQEEDVPRGRRYDVVEFDVDGLEGDITDAIKHLQAVRDKYPGQEFHLVIEHNYDGVEVELHVWREETDEEFQERLRELRVNKWIDAENARIASIKRKWNRKTHRDNLVNRITELQAELNSIDERSEEDV